MGLARRKLRIPYFPQKESNWTVRWFNGQKVVRKSFSDDRDVRKFVELLKKLGRRYRVFNHTYRVYGYNQMSQMRTRSEFIPHASSYKGKFARREGSMFDDDWAEFNRNIGNFF